MRPIDGSPIDNVDMARSRLRTRASIRKNIITAFVYAREWIIAALTNADLVEPSAIELSPLERANRTSAPIIHEQLFDFGLCADPHAPTHSREEYSKWLADLDLPAIRIPSAWQTLIGHPDISEANQIAQTPEPDHLICPACGPIVPIVVGIRTPRFTWEILVGRAWEHLCCPKCLGCFGTWGTMMS